MQRLDQRFSCWNLILAPAEFFLWLFLYFPNFCKKNSGGILTSSIFSLWIFSGCWHVHHLISFILCTWLQNCLNYLLWFPVFAWLGPIFQIYSKSLAFWWPVNNFNDTINPWARYKSSGFSTFFTYNLNRAVSKYQKYSTFVT